MDKLLDLNLYEILFVLATISILAVLLNKIFFKPVGGMIKEREKKVKADSDILKNMLEEIQEKTTQIESELKKAKRGASRIKEDLIEEGESVREKIVEETRNRTKEMMERKMAELDKALTDAEKKLEKEIASFSDKIKEKFL